MANKTMKKGTKIAIAVVSSIILMFAITITTLCIIYIDDTNIEYEEFVLNGDNTQGQALKIAHLSDLHFPKIKVDIDAMLKVIDEEKVDFIALTGDIIDNTADVRDCGVLEFVEKLALIAPVYFVNGNHEVNHKEEVLLYNSMLAAGVIMLENESVYFDIGDKQVTIMGVTDNANLSPSLLDKTPNKDNYKILLAHRPEKELTNGYSTSQSAEGLWRCPDLVLSGHAHGGQFRIGEQGLFAPNQGFFPEFDAGLYELTEKTSMVLSRGIGNSVIPFRFNNKPHLPIITIYLS